MSEVDVATILLKGEKQDFILNKKDFKTGSRGYPGQGKMHTCARALLFPAGTLKVLQLMFTVRDARKS